MVQTLGFPASDPGHQSLHRQGSLLTRIQPVHGIHRGCLYCNQPLHDRELARSDVVSAVVRRDSLSKFVSTVSACGGSLGVGAVPDLTSACASHCDRNFLLSVPACRVCSRVATHRLALVEFLGGLGLFPHFAVPIPSAGQLGGGKK